MNIPERKYCIRACMCEYDDGMCAADCGNYEPLSSDVVLGEVGEHEWLDYFRIYMTSLTTHGKDWNDNILPEYKKAYKSAFKAGFKAGIKRANLA